jgi:hypothetical protein
MKNAYIKFLTDADRSEAFQRLSTIAQIMSLSDEIFCIPVTMLRLLDDQQIKYMHASSDEVTRTDLRTWRFAHP